MVVYRPQGEPFLCHLVRTASIVLAEGQSLPVVQAALLHAAYSLRRRAGSGGERGARRAALRRAAGPDVEQLVFAYDQLPWNSAAQLERHVEGFGGYDQTTRSGRADAPRQRARGSSGSIDGLRLRRLRPSTGPVPRRLPRPGESGRLRRPRGRAQGRVRRAARSTAARGGGHRTRAGLHAAEQTLAGTVATAPNGARSDAPDAAKVPLTSLPADDVRVLRRFECLLVVLVLLLVAAHGRDDAWPFIVWPMYARGYPPPPRLVSETELRLVSRDGAVMRLLPADLFTHVEIDLGRRITVASVRRATVRGGVSPGDSASAATVAGGTGRRRDRRVDARLDAPPDGGPGVRSSRGRSRRFCSAACACRTTSHHPALEWR